MKTNLEAWAFNFLGFAIVLPLVMGSLAHYHKVDQQVKNARVEGCIYARQHFIRQYVDCEGLLNE